MGKWKEDRDAWIERHRSTLEQRFLDKKYDEFLDFSDEEYRNSLSNIEQFMYELDKAER